MSDPERDKLVEALHEAGSACNEATQAFWYGVHRAWGEDDNKARKEKYKAYNEARKALLEYDQRKAVGGD